MTSHLFHMLLDKLYVPTEGRAGNMCCGRVCVCERERLSEHVVWYLGHISSRLVFQCQTEFKSEVLRVLDECFSLRVRKLSRFLIFAIMSVWLHHKYIKI